MNQCSLNPVEPAADGVGGNSPVNRSRFAKTAFERLRILERYRNIAMVGLSSNPFRPSHFAAIYLIAEGYQVVPVNPRESQVRAEVLSVAQSDPRADRRRRYISRVGGRTCNRRRSDRDRSQSGVDTAWRGQRRSSQARPRSKGLGQPDRGPRWDARPSRLGLLRRPCFLSLDKVFLLGRVAPLKRRVP